MNKKEKLVSLVTSDISQDEKNNLVTDDVLKNPIIQRTLQRVKENQKQENNSAGFVNHGSHNTHSKGLW